MYHEFMQLIEGAKGAFPAARNTNLPCIPATRIETKPWSLIGEESEAQLLARFTEYAERNDLQLLLWTFCNQKGDIALVCSKTMEATLLHSRSGHLDRKMISRKKSLVL